MKLFLISVMIFACGLSVSAEDWQKFMLENSGPMLSSTNAGESAMTVAKKNPKAAFLFSATVPGAGQVYAKSYIKAAVFLAVEAAAWTFYVAKTNDGHDIEDEFHAYADEHWSETEYWRWISHHSGIAFSEENMEALRSWEGQSFSHGLHRDKDQQYFEMIGKYHQFSWGWDDFREDNSITATDEEITHQYNLTKELNENRRYYETRRNASNDAFKKATTGATIAVMNHLLSAIDAAWTTTKYNRRVDVSLHVEPIYFAQEIQTVLTLQVNW